jgi:hypothetical protein
MSDDPLFDPAPSVGPRVALRAPRRLDYFGRVPLGWMIERDGDTLIPAPLRLYLYLQVASRWGTYLVRLTNQIAAVDIGLSRDQKSEYLHFLEALGLITVHRAGKRTPIITVVWPPPATIRPTAVGYRPTQGPFIDK